MSTPLLQLFGYANRTLILEVRFSNQDQDPTLTIYHNADEFDYTIPSELMELPDDQLSILLSDETQCGKFLYLIDKTVVTYRRMDFSDCYLHTLPSGLSYIAYTYEGPENSLSEIIQLEQRDFNGQILAQTSIPNGYVFTQSLLSLDGTKVAILTQGQDPDVKDINDGRKIFIWDLSTNIISEVASYGSLFDINFFGPQEFEAMVNQDTGNIIITNTKTTTISTVYDWNGNLLNE